MDRRNFIKNSSLITVGLIAAPHMALSQERKFKLCLAPGKIGVQADQKTLLSLAHQYGFEAMVAFPDDLVAMTKAELESLLAEMKDKNIAWGSSGLPIEFRQDRETFEKDLQLLPKRAEALQKAGVKGMGTWIMPTHKTLTYQENFEQTSERLSQVAQVLDHYDIQLGLEYVAPKTLMARDKFSFVHTLKELKELIEGIGEPNVGVVLDSFHWHCAQDTVADILTLDKTDIVTVDFNDARKGLTPDTQVDGRRELPGATGVIDMKGFVGALIQVGYEGPVRAEPFNKELNEMEDEAAIQATYTAMKQAAELE